MSATASQSTPTLAESRSRFDRLALPAIVVLAALLRLGWLQHTGLHAPPVGDEAWYIGGATGLVTGHGFVHNGVLTAFPLPGWPLLLVPVFALFGHGAAVARIAACLLDALAVIPIAAAARSLAGRRAAMLAALWGALHPPMLFYSATAMTEAASCFWVATAVWLLFRSRLRGARAVALLGLALGCACLTRPSVMSIAIAAGIAIVLVPPSTRGVRRLALMVACLVLVLAPWIARNAIVFGRPVLSSQTLFQLWQAAHPGATGTNRVDWPATLRYSATLPGDEFDVSDQMGREATQFIRTHPLEYARLGVVKAWELWKPWSPGVPLVQNVLYLAASLPLALLGLAGMLSRRRDRFERVFGLLAIVLFTVVHALYTAVIRYRVPLDAILIVYAAAWIADRRRPQPADAGAPHTRAERVQRRRLEAVGGRLR